MREIEFFQFNQFPKLVWQTGKLVVVEFERGEGREGAQLGWEGGETVSTVATEQESILMNYSCRVHAYTRVLGGSESVAFQWKWAVRLSGCHEPAHKEDM